MGTRLNRLRSFLWGADPKDAALLSKLDLTILPYFSIIWFLFGLSRASYGSAYISGMKEDLGFKGKDYNYLSTTYLVVYAICQMPGTSLLTIFPPKYVFVSANVTWSVLTLITFKMQHVWQVILLNGFEGGFCAIAYVGAHFIYASWYKKSELGTRAAIFCCFGHVGSMAGGWIQAGLLADFSGRQGLPAWRWIFIIVSVITIPTAIFGQLDLHPGHAFASECVVSHPGRERTCLPPTRPTKETHLGQDGLQARAPILAVLAPAHNLHACVHTPLFSKPRDTEVPTLQVYSLAIQMLSNNVFPLWLLSRGYTTIQQNNYPTAVYATAILGTILYSVISDKIQSRWQCSLAVGLTFILGSAILISNPRQDAGHFVAFYLLGTTYAPQALWYSWMADVTAHDFQLRALTTGFMNSWDFAWVTWWPIIFYPVTDAPNYRKGYIASLVTGALIIPLVGVIAYLEKKGLRNGTLGRERDEEVRDERGDMSGEAIVEALHVPEKY
ncbi:putative major facilitator superfamily permease-6 [Coleophoma cylindrospora]|uniref:Putative major facilitator superfamily permease-6 n=1 Tax=Coleophoma cylindrospora TaxID=1849047 RepID=A0A3D8RSY9_9HELO|nr:putative major facilitator superfamily permease-6 [Coleophoma cylindrospora]